MPRAADWQDYENEQWSSEFLDLDPIEEFRQVMRVQRSLHDEDDILHWYHFIMVVVTPGRAPQPVVRWEGIELSRHSRLSENLYRFHGHNLSFPRDMETGEFTHEVRNPVTGEMVSPPVMALTEDPGYFRAPEGIIPLDKPEQPFRPVYKKLRREGDMIKVDNIRVPPATWPVTFIEMGHEGTARSLYHDQSRLWLPTDVSGGYVFPYPAWMEMGERPGHMFATWSGYKLRSVEQLPPEFLERANKERPDLLRVNPQLFDRSVSLPAGYQAS
ncbi:hypothetical protein [Altererythrobacter sp. GH1-8]|uniref:hypothetical protein n=1 Tax=Altererythrobacter sp. GH1-8 TaxID=3349333 RepID=UPI00374DA885